VDESLLVNESPADYVRRLALAKALAAADKNPNLGADALIIGADTIVVVDARVLGKPASRDDAKRMLRSVSGRIHEVHSGLALLQISGMQQRVVEEITRVHFAHLGDQEIEEYLVTGEPFDKAGAYAIQGMGGRFVKRIEGCYFNVMGLPLARLWTLLREFGFESSAENQRDAK